MTLAQVQAAVAIVVALIATWSGLLMAVALALPELTGRAEHALEARTRRCFVNGIASLLLLVLSVALLRLPNPLAKVIGQALMLLLAATLTVGMAGIAQLMGKRIGEMSGAKTSFGALARGSLVLSLALFFPYMGWLIFAPISSVCAAGAGAIALIPKHREARPKVTSTVEATGTA